MSQGLSPSTALKDERNPQRQQHLDRSPHPYSLQSLTAPERSSSYRQGRPNPLPLSADRFLGFATNNVSRRRAQAHSWNRDNPTSPSDSGTEADDERPLLKALTAPPLRPRKGLKSAKTYITDPLASPLLTPSAFEDENYSKLLTAYAAQERKKGKLASDEASSKAKARRKRYGRVELIRRALETILLGAVGYIGLRERNRSDIRGKQTPWSSAKHLSNRSIVAICWHVLLIAIVYFAYVLRLVIRSFTVKGNEPFWTRFKIPATADPAPLLYPIFLPILVTWSIRPLDKHVILSNYILSFSALPRRLIPQYDFHLHWMLSLVPLLNHQIMRRYGIPQDLLSDNPLISKAAIEEHVLLFPLQCMLLQTLGYLTTTSLLPAELQLLSITLINLLRFGLTPQSLILKGLLWIGGVLLIASCRHILQWSVELARVPSWRFRRRKHCRRSRSTIICALNDTFGAWFGGILRASKRQDESSDEEQPWRISRKGKLEVSENQVDSMGHTMDGMNRVLRGKQTSADDLSYREKGPAQPLSVDIASLSEKSKRRRHTLPSNLTPLADIPLLTKTASNALSSAHVRSKLLLRLTVAQATLLKWLYATFVYLTVITIILVPVRGFIGNSALNKQEPIGWALGYLFGNLDIFRFRVVILNLERWICLPERYATLENYPGLGEQLRLAALGPANTRLLICGWCFANIVAGLIVVFRLSNVVEVDTRRKVFHGMMVSMFLPTILVDPAFIALAFTLILAVFLLLDLFRASQLPPVSKPLTHFLAPYVDGRDHRGPIIVSHIFLLIGCAIPLWLSLADVKRSGHGPFQGWDVEIRDISMVSGVVCVGMGDAAASLIGRRFGHRRWPWSGGKSLEGSAAFAIAVVLGLMASRFWLLMGEWKGDSGNTWLTTLTKSTIAACGVSLTEAVLTGGNDNVIVPVILWILVKGLGV